MMAIKLFVTGGTIDCEGVEAGKYIFGDTHMPEMLKQARNRTEIIPEILMLKNSDEMTEHDRNKILEKCRSCEEDKIIISHGTISMVETARLLGKNIKNKTIVLFGAVVPYNKKNSDALFNLGGAIAGVQLLPKGVYIAMNGKLFAWDNVRKNEELLEFE